MKPIYYYQHHNGELNLNEPENQIIVQATCDITLEESNAIIEQILEKNGKHNIEKLLKHPLITPERIALTVTHKKTFVISLLVELIMDNVLQREDINIFSSGMNIVYTNVLYRHLSNDYPKEMIDDMLNKFLKMTHDFTDENIDLFYATIVNLLDVTKDGQMRTILKTILKNQYEVSQERFLDCLLFTREGKDFEICETAFVNHVKYWHNRHKSDLIFTVELRTKVRICTDMASSLSDSQLSSLSTGYDKRSYESSSRLGTFYPDSTSRCKPQIILLRLLSEALLNEHFEDVSKFIIDGSVFPSKFMTLDELGTNRNPVDLSIL